MITESNSPSVRRLIAALIAVAAVDWAAAADADRGKALDESRCVACHSIDANRVGPKHQGLFGRRAGSVADFDYSPAVKASGLIWDDARLDRWLANPEQLIAGQKMGYSVPEAGDRADLIAYLKQATR